MKNNFWIEKWEKNEIGFHENSGNQIFQNYISNTKISPPKRFLVPLCGKSYDLHWLAKKGHFVTGIELSEIATKDFFHENQIDYTVISKENFLIYSSESIEIYVGDFFEIKRSFFEKRFDYIYDRAALVALPEKIRQKYCEKLYSLAKGATQLLISFIYDPTKKEGPPFSIDNELLDSLYSKFYKIKKIDSSQSGHRLEKLPGAIEALWKLSPY